MKIELTEKQLSSLRFYLYKTEGRRKEEVELWRNLAKGEKEKEVLRKTAEENVKFLNEMNKDLSEVYKILNNAEE